MYNSIQHFVKYGIFQFRRNTKNFYEKASQFSGGEGQVSRETVMRHVHRIHMPS